MDRKRTVWIGMLAGTYLCGLIPTLWGASFFSPSAFLFSTLGGIVGIWIGYKVGS